MEEADLVVETPKDNKERSDNSPQMEKDEARPLAFQTKEWRVSWTFPKISE